ncbi:CoA:oxalate CoA-transferase [Dethiosulfatibacter aminovorans DSM 17477]|uniref:CoA:oxalate CoA-transferase n=1 Tax=Dethiosulfatibacter aminovorans DSM 17477 TaxID=1121476 RepID=A0A1M6IZ90_9FIRM|nr:CaiB/BaiF CoA-transferase family protein [Dethiosulfatibacter aminovorans]SHJ39710.1 CoA:oxalate CoA-transferase [Dethiosulfatibacter aminovorans DSM 17477]
MKVLEGVKVIDFTQAYSGPFCTMNLADFGAEVIKIERRGMGDQSREWTPLENGHSGYYAAINRNKKGVSLDIASEEGRKVILDMVKDADIIVQNFKVGTLDKFGLGYEDMKKVNPGIIYACISGFGQYGPLHHLAAYDNVVQAMTGIMEMTGDPEGIPTKVGPAIGDNFTGLYMATAITMAYLHKLNTGEGQKLDVAMYDAIFSILESPILFETVLGETCTRTGNADPATLVPYDVYKCKDGYFSAGIASDRQWPSFCEAIKMPELIEDPRFVENGIRCENYAPFTEIVSDFFAQKTRSELADIFVEAGVPNAPVFDIPEVMEHPQIKARDMMLEMDDPGVGKHLAIGNPMKLSKTPPVLEHGAPLLGQDTEAVLKSIGYDDNKIKELFLNEVI